MNMIIMEITAASTRVRATSLRELRMLSALSLTILDIQVLVVRLQAFDTSWTSDDTSMAVLLCCLEMDRDMVSWPLYLEMPPLCSSASYTLAISSI